jgi:hypothetical protein
VQGIERVDRELLDAEALVGHLVPAGGMFAFLAAHRQDVFGDNEFEDLFPSGLGRPSIPASVMATRVSTGDADVDEAAELMINLFWRGMKGKPSDKDGQQVQPHAS